MAGLATPAQKIPAPGTTAAMPNMARQWCLMKHFHFLPSNYLAILNI